MPRGASLTAEAVCFFRAVENARPPGERLLADAFAERLLPAAWRPWVGSSLMQLGFRSRVPIGPGALQSFVAARHRWIDDALTGFLAAGGEQVVILGAGYDSRALRFRNDLGKRPIVEVDFPATQTRKQVLIAERIPEVKSPATYLSIDFETHTLEQGLLAGAERHSFLTGKRTFYVWEGVAMYLHPETVDQTLATLRKLSAKGSEIACDMWSRPTEATFDARVRRAGARMLRSIGEPIRFALDPKDAARYFQDRGFVVRDLCDSEQLAARYRCGKRKLFPDNSVVRAMIV